MNNSTINQHIDDISIPQSEIIKKKDLSKKSFENNMLSQTAITVFFASATQLIFQILKMATDESIPKYYMPLLAFPLSFFIISYIYPKFTGSFGSITAKELRHKIGFFLPENLGKNILLGISLALCTLSGLLLGSFLSKEFVFDIHSLTIDQIIFSTMPGVWEEVFYRGCMMIILLNWVKNVKKAIIIQSILFGLAHLSGFGIWEVVDTFFVILMGFLFTYCAEKTNSLIPGIIFHFIHDAFIFVVQPPFDQQLSDLANTIIFGVFLIMIFVAFLLVKLVTEKGNLIQKTKLYDLAKIQNR